MDNRKMVHVQWVDSMFEPTGWTGDGDMLEPDMRCESMGFLVEKTRKYIRIAHSRDLQGPKESFAGLFTIPRSAITRLEYVEEEE